jgi:diacylglycerol kinase family enzyme
VSAAGRIALVVNPAATKAGRTLRSQTVRTLAPLGLEWSLVTRGPGDAGRLAAEAAAQGATVVVTLGGDGTAADVAGALAGGPVAMAPMPGGNANVFARALGWPARAADALPLLGVSLRAGAVREAGLGVVEAGEDRRVFAINAGMGIDAATVEWIEARPRTKRRLRQAGFAIGVAVAAARAGRSARLRVEGEGIEPTEAVAVIAACGTPYTYLGRWPLDLVPGAAFDGALAWVALTRMRPHELTGLLARAIAGRPLPLGGPALRGGGSSGGIDVWSDVPAAVQADGEALGRHTHMRVMPGPRLRVIDPRSVAALKSGRARPT